MGREIKSVKEIVEYYIGEVKQSNTALAESSITCSTSEDPVTSLAVNVNGTVVNKAAMQVAASISDHIRTDSDRIIDISDLFETQDRELAGALTE